MERRSLEEDTRRVLVWGDLASWITAFILVITSLVGVKPVCGMF